MVWTQRNGCSWANDGTKTLCAWLNIDDEGAWWVWSSFCHETGATKSGWSWDRLDALRLAEIEANQC